MSYEQKKEIFGVTTIRLEVIDITKLEDKAVKKFIIKGKFLHNIKNIPAFLINQVSKNDIEDKPINGQIIISIATEKRSNAISWRIFNSITCISTKR
ncbi:MAG: hypothetical protein ABF695_12255 [Liquorilactobacillus ghanensis]|uniref:hypothetical protein n=1 Tax=Liquorilactobacillus ghanensis TaxID=399370 RepID=UPI0039E9BF54